MDAHERQQFDFLLLNAVERYVERLEQRNQGAVHALARLRDDPEGETIRLSEYLDALLGDFLLDNADGSAFLLRALARRRIEPSGSILPTGPASVEDWLRVLARTAFGDLLIRKTAELLEQHAAYASEPE